MGMLARERLVPREAASIQFKRFERFARAPPTDALAVRAGEIPTCSASLAWLSVREATLEGVPGAVSVSAPGAGVDEVSSGRLSIQVASTAALGVDGAEECIDDALEPCWRGGVE